MTINSNPNLDLRFFQIKDKKNVSNPLNLWSKFLLKSQRINLHRIRILKAHLHEQNCLQTDLIMNQTITFNSETSMRIRSRNKSEFRSHERNHLFDHIQFIIYLKILYWCVLPSRQERRPRPHHEGAAITRWGRVWTGDQTTASPMPWPLDHDIPI